MKRLILILCIMTLTVNTALGDGNSFTGKTAINNVTGGYGEWQYPFELFNVGGNGFYQGDKPNRAYTFYDAYEYGVGKCNGVGTCIFSSDSQPIRFGGIRLGIITNADQMESNYTGWGSLSSSGVSISKPGAGITLVSPNQTTYCVSVQDNGVLITKAGIC